jgi:hypothetical protein
MAKPAAKKQPRVVLVAQSDTPTDNFPFSKTQAQQQYTKYLSDMFAKGYVYSGILSQSVGPTMVNFLVFYQR